MKYTKEDCYPMWLVQKINTQYPKIFDTIDDFTNKHKNQWDKRVYIPSPCLMNESKNKFGDTLETMNLIHVVVQVATWRREKQIYKFDKTLLDMLYKQTDTNIRIPKNILAQLPLNCFYIEAENLANGLDGVFVYYDLTPEEELSLIITGRYKDNRNFFNVITNIEEDKDISEILKHHKQHLKNKGCNKQDIREYVENSMVPLIRVLQLLLYICSKNADITPNERQFKIYKKPTIKIRDKFSEVKIDDVGVNIVKAFKEKYNYYYTHNTGSKRGSLKSPHIRKGHFHKYWIGTGENKKIEIKWISATIIHKEANINNITVNEIIDK